MGSGLRFPLRTVPGPRPDASPTKDLREERMRSGGIDRNKSNRISNDRSSTVVVVVLVVVNANDTGDFALGRSKEGRPDTSCSSLFRLVIIQPAMIGHYAAVEESRPAAAVQ
jgi:hypothetical protein